MSFDGVRARVQQYYDAKIAAHGATAQGVDWNSADSQTLRFDELLKLIDGPDSFTINDFGCGYGALADYLKAKRRPVRYIGFDISDRMIALATDLHAGTDWISFVTAEAQLPAADYTVASGIFNVKLETASEEWKSYILETLRTINSISQVGFAFNALTKYSDPGFMRSDLYYADPLFLFDYCKTNFSRLVTLLHDYPLYEFTIIVRRA